jgi:serine protease Do
LQFGRVEMWTKFDPRTLVALLLLATFDSRAEAKAVPAPKAEAELRDFSDAVAAVAESAVPSVVNISTTQITQRPQVDLPQDLHPFFREFFEGLEGGGPQKQQSLGSGVLVREDGTILTSNHIVAGGGDIMITLHDGRSYPAKIVGTDPKSDLAVVRIENPPRSLTAIQLGNSDQLRVGEVVVAIGNPFGVGQTVTMGIVSAKGRANIGIVEYEDFIQTDAAINPGNSGGALVNLEGELIGINTAILSRSGGYQGIGFSIPTNMAAPIMNSLLTQGRVVRGWLGAMIQDLTPELAAELRIRDRDGILVSEVLDDTPAAKAGLEPGDLILSIDGQTLKSATELRGRIAAHRPGETITLAIARNGREKTVRVRLGELEDRQQAQVSEEHQTLLSGLEVRELDPELRRRLQLPPKIESGAVVVEMQPGCAAERSGLMVGDVILDVGRKSIRSVEDLRDRIGPNDKRVLLRVHRGGGSMFLLLRK